MRLNECKRLSQVMYRRSLPYKEEQHGFHIFIQLMTIFFILQRPIKHNMVYSLW